RQSPPAAASPRPRARPCLRQPRRWKVCCSFHFHTHCVIHGRRHQRAYAHFRHAMATNPESRTNAACLDPGLQDEGYHFRGMPAFSITASHFLISDLSFAISSSGVLPFAVTPTLAKRSFRSGSASTSCMALFIVSIASFGVPLGANTPFQDVTS